MKKHSSQAGFTLVELAIVLVIIGLLVGGVLVGQDLIKAAEIRAVSSDIERFNTGAAAFRTKYNGVPGDLVSTTAASFGLTVSATTPGSNGYGDGDNQLENGATVPTGLGGENTLFWRHLSDAQFIPFGSTADGAVIATTAFVTPATAIAAMLPAIPQLRIRDTGFIHAYGGSGLNYYMIASYFTNGGATGALTASDALSPREALGIDEKLDDGNGSKGIVVSFEGALASASAPSGGASAPVAGECYDNDTAPYAYATNTEDLANAIGCALRVRAGF